MREIKFRARNYANSAWIYFNLRLILQAEYPNEFFKDINPETLQKFTGLKDKNKEDIYEGDIVRWGNSLEIVEWKVDSDADYGNCEVIGNIYENPELIK